MSTPSRPPGAYRGLAVVGVLLVLGGLGYGGWGWATQARPSETPLSEQPFEEACSWPRRYFPTTATYHGPGPHPVQLMLEQQSASGGYYTQMLLFSTATQQVPEHWNPSDPSTVELVACLHPTKEGRQVGTCNFDDSTHQVPVLEATYEVDVYEAQTGAEVAHGFIQNASETNCPMVLTYNSSDEPTVYTEPSLTELHEALDALTDRPAREGG